MRVRSGGDVATRPRWPYPGAKCVDVLDDLATHARPLSRSERAPGAQAMAELDLHAARAFIATCRWTFAKTVPQHPHEYCLRDWVPDNAEFDRFTALIAGHGYSGRFWS